MMKSIALCFIYMFPATLFAAILPKPQPYDYRITQAQYNPENVIRIRTGVGFNTLIQLEEGETISTPNAGMGMGDAQAWGLDIKGNNFFLKPIATNPDTNLTVVTNKNRTYSFLLELSDYPHFIVRMVYEKPKTAKSYTFDIPCHDGTTNFDYWKWGDDALSPDYMWDDGRFTCLKFTNAAELPVAYQVASDGTESMINYHIEKDTMILHGTSKEFRLRLGQQVLGLRTDGTFSKGYNEKASSVDAKREVKHE